MFVPIHPPEISPRAEELARRIREVITAYQATHPDLSGVELQQAMMRAAMTAGPVGSGAGAQRPAILLAAVAFGLFVALGLGLFLAERGGQGNLPWPAIAAIIVLVAIAGVIFTIRRSSD